MRVIAGQARGIQLYSPKDKSIRPTLDRVRESLFNIIAPRVAGAAFLDCFAGTGANGIEALSRGADQALFLDQDARALELIRRNLEKTRLAAAAHVRQSDLPAGLSRIDGLFDIVFADPPFSFKDYGALLDAVSRCSCLRDGGVVIVEHRRKAALPESEGSLERYRQAHYGETALSFYA